jgi:hypothetical protein
MKKKIIIIIIIIHGRWQLYQCCADLVSTLQLGRQTAWNFRRAVKSAKNIPFHRQLSV